MICPERNTPMPRREQWSLEGDGVAVCMTNRIVLEAVVRTMRQKDQRHREMYR
jgi:hypothetical protein